jgi:hypothetical protein
MPLSNGLSSQLKKDLITMGFKMHSSRFRTIRSKDPNFNLVDGMLVIPRAGFEIVKECPREYKLIIQDCLERGWLKPVATVYDHELTFDMLKDITQ